MKSFSGSEVGEESRFARRDPDPTFLASVLLKNLGAVRIMSDQSMADVGDLLQKAIDHHRQGELTKAEWAYMEILERDPENIDALHLIGVVAHQVGDTKSAIERVQQSLVIKSDQPNALNNLGNMLVDADRREEAIESYRRAIELEPDYARAHHNLGNVLGDCDRIAEAVQSYRRALELQPDDVESRLALGAVLERLGQLKDAEAEYRSVLEIDAGSISAHNRLGAVLRKQRRLDDAKSVYQRWLEIDPKDPVALHFLAACSPDQAPDRASPQYIKKTFDSHSEEFEDCLADLNYQVPKLLGEMICRHLGDSPQGDLAVADLGCGTGLCATYLRDYAEQLDGIDLSPGMLAKADEKKVYDSLVEADLIEHLDGSSDRYDLLVAADTLIYLGDLRTTFRAAHHALRAGGKLLFNVEKIADDLRAPGYGLQHFGRYAHQQAQIRLWLEEAGFEVTEFIEATLREEGNEDATGFLVMAFKRG
jgi:predicted TPR repeat methyltransferase